MNLVDIVNQDHLSANVKKFPEFKPGDTLAVSVRIKEGEKSRIQVYQGTCIAIRDKSSINGSFVVRKTSNGIGVERVFPFHSPAVDSVEVVQRGKSRKAKLYYLRERSGKGARVSIDYDRKSDYGETQPVK